MQDKIVIDIGRIAIKDKGNLEPYQFFVQDAFPEKKDYPILLLVFSVQDNETIIFDKVDPDIGNIEKFKKYGYRKGSSRGGDITFTTKISEAFETKLSTLKNNQLPTVLALAKKAEYLHEVKIFESLSQTLKNQEIYEEIVKEIKSSFDGLTKDEKKGTLFSLRFDYEDGTEKYISDFKTFQDIILINGTEDKGFKYGVSSEGHDSQCSICMEKKPLLYGFASPFKYFTVDKPGMVSGFFKQENTWKNYPICSDCSLPFELGRDYISQNLQGYFYGRPFYVIPKLIFGSDESKLKGILKRLKDLYNEMSVKKAGKIERAEDYIMEAMGDEKDTFNVNLMFFEEDSKTKAIKIKLLLEEVLPSRFRMLFVTIPDEIKVNPIYQKAITIKKEEKNLVFNYGILKTFFDNDFLDLVQKLFDGKPLSKEVIFAKFMDKIRRNYNESQTSDGFVEPTSWTVLKSHQALSYFQKLNLIHFNKYIYMDTFDSTIQTKSKGNFSYQKFSDFINKNTDFFDDDIKVGIFGLGILVRYTMNIQYQKIKSTPFEKKLRGYDLSIDDMQHIYQEALAKLRQFKVSGFYTELREDAISKFLLNKHNPKRFSKDELSLYFVTGIEWAMKFRGKSIEVEEETEEGTEQI